MFSRILALLAHPHFRNSPVLAACIFLAFSCLCSDPIVAASGAVRPQRFMPGEILVKFKPGLSEDEIKGMNRSYGTSIIEHIKDIDLYRLQLPEGSDVHETIDAYSQDTRVQYAEPNYMGRGGDFIPNDLFFDQQWHLNNIGQTGGVTDADIDAVEGWQLAMGSSTIVVAVLDTGIDSDHLEFQSRFLHGFDFVNEDGDPEADHPHGVWVSGILAANSDNNFAVAGVDHNATILPIKVLNENNGGSVADLVQGLVFVANQGADVINMSLINYPLTASLNDALQFARNAGSILVACAGNGGIGNADFSGPGASPLTISIGATDDDDARASFSGTGAALDLVAPGVSLPTVFWNSNDDQFALFSGCSAATPVVSGIATLLLSLDPSLTHDEVREILIATAEDEIGPPAEDVTGRDDFFGFGRVNLRDALSELMVQVAVDVRPQQCPNLLAKRVALPFHNALPVAILGTPLFDVFEIDVQTVQLAGVKPRHHKFFKDIATPFEPFLGKEEATDCTRDGPDGFTDLLLRFDQRKMIRALGPISHKDVIVVPLTGALDDGTSIIGEDVIVVIDQRSRTASHSGLAFDTNDVE